MNSCLQLGSGKPNRPGPSDEDEEIGALGYGAIAAGAVANPITLWSAYTLKASASSCSHLPEIEGTSLSPTFLYHHASLSFMAVQAFAKQPF